MPVIKMPDGTDVSFPDAMPSDQIRNLIASKFPQDVKQHLSASAGQPAEPDDHGYARRQQMNWAERLAQPITEYPEVYRQMRQESESQVSRGLSQLGEAFGKAKGGLWEPGEAGNLWTGAKGAANVGLGALGFIGSPGAAALRTTVGQPVEDLTGIPREYTEFAAQLAAPGVGFSRMPRAPGVAEPVPLVRPSAEPPGRPVVAEAAERLNAIPGVQVDVPRAVTGDLPLVPERAVQSTAQHVSKVPYVGQPIGEAIHTTLPKQLEEARNAVAAEHGVGTGANVAERAGATLSDAAAAETKAAEEAAARTNEQAAAEWQQAQQQREAEIAQREQQATQAAQQSVGSDVAPRDMGDTVINHVRANEQQAQAAKNAAYADAASRDASILDDANGSLASSIERDLRTPGPGRVDLTADAASTARGMMTRIRQFANDARQRAAQAQQEAIAGGGTAEDAAQTGRSMRDIEGLRQDLNFHAQGASNDADRRASTRILHAFDNWQENAMGNSLMDGSDPEALTAFQRARAANRDWRERFGYNGRDDADKLINKIVRGEDDQHIGAVGVSDALTTPGDKAGPLFSRVMEATGSHPDVVQAIRSGTWNKLSQSRAGATEGAGARPAAKIRTDIYDYLHGKGRDVANRVFTPEQRDLMHRHADTLFNAVGERDVAAAAAKASKPVPIEAQPGPIQQLADRVIGKGQKSPDALFDVLHGYAKKGGDPRTLARVVQQLPQDMRGDLAGAMIRKLGESPTTRQFSLDHFANHWEGLSPEGKAVMFGTAGPHLQALNDIATIAKELKIVKGRFGNPSGTTGGNLFGALVAMASGSTLGALKTAGLGGAGYLVSRILASPAGASSVAKYAKAVERANRLQTPETMAAAKLTQRNLANTMRALSAVRAPPQ